MLFKEELADNLGCTYNEVEAVLRLTVDRAFVTCGDSVIIDSRVGIPDSVLEFEYDNDYGTQEVFGIIVFNNGAWLERGEHDGSEWWEYRSTPTDQDVFDG